MNIVLCADESYARYGSVVMASVIAHAINIEQIRFFMLTPGMSEETKNSLRESVELPVRRRIRAVFRAIGIGLGVRNPTFAREWLSEGGDDV